VADDDPALLKLADRYLTRLGYAVTMCRTAQEAWSRFEAGPEKFALALIDLTLRDQPGDDLARRMIGYSPTVKILLWSGYPYNLQNFGVPAADRVGFLGKPFSPGSLGAAIEGLLSGHHQASD
jgi:DNA-binding response OmpR family regulator